MVLHGNAVFGIFGYFGVFCILFFLLKWVLFIYFLQLDQFGSACCENVCGTLCWII